MVQIKGGDQLEKYLKEMGAAANQKAFVDVGFMGNATEKDGTRVVEVAAYNEYGTSTIPPRPFFRSMVAKHSKEWPDDLAKALKRNKFNAATSLGQLGLKIRDQLQLSIRDLTEPPLAESTIARKGFDKPLIDTSTMLKSATLRVRTGDTE